VLNVDLALNRCIASTLGALDL